MRLLHLNVHPLKSGAVRPVDAASVLPRGLVDDRTWMVVDRDLRVVSAREVPALFTVEADTPATDPTVRAALRLRAPGAPDLHLDAPRGAAVTVHLFSLDLPATPAGAEADAWLRDVLGHDVRLVFCHDPSRRRLQPGFSEPGDHTAFADSFPVTIASLASLRRLDDWMTERALELGEEPPAPLPVERFRPNLVIDGEEPFAEDHWTSLRVGEVRFRVAKPVPRCVMATLDPATLTTSKEPTRTLARHRFVSGKTLFAVHQVPVTSGRIGVGDPVTAS